QMPVNAVRTGVELAVMEPADVQVARIEGNVLYLRERLDPVEALRLLRPEAFRVLDGAAIGFRVGVGVENGSRGDVAGNGIKGIAAHGSPPSPESSAFAVQCRIRPAFNILDFGCNRAASFRPKHNGAGIPADQ